MSYTLSELLNDEYQVDPAQLEGMQAFAQANPYYYSQNETSALADRMDRMRMPMSSQEQTMFNQSADQMASYDAFARQNPYYFTNAELDMFDRRKQLMKKHPRLSSLLSTWGMPSAFGSGNFGRRY